MSETTAAAERPRDDADADTTDSAADAGSESPEEGEAARKAAEDATTGSPTS
ncbi:hypothetical protein [Microbacterium sp. RU33B]|uniref:hypothetical protein n=1 Tax=Microbacterium sp. RU33B TaxID=1907390 RepID=UPI00095FA823|nr:hypothetical protein [Microbacterium sp. RU33B]SIT67476.1 hypothetical protein SAMN05880545_0172 [Microbacterium sp. RU33B]